MAELTPGIPTQNVLLEPEGLHSEILDGATRQVWQSRAAITSESWDALELEAPLRKAGIGRAAMDAHYFRRSPGADSDGPLETREFGGREYVYCARPILTAPLAAPANRAGGSSGPMQLEVDKYHTLVYRAGREIGVIRLPDGLEYIHVIEAGPDKQELELPESWARTEVALPSDLTVHLPAPTTVFFFANGDSYQGPVERIG